MGLDLVSGLLQIIITIPRSQMRLNAPKQITVILILATLLKDPIEEPI